MSEEIKPIPGTVVASYKPRPPPQNGRKKGSKNKLTLLREAVLTKTEYKILDELPKIIAVVCKKAEEGDLTAAKLILERIIPVRKQTEGNEGAKGPPVITINIEGASSGRSSITIEQPSMSEHSSDLLLRNKPALRAIEDGEYHEVNEEEEDGN